MRIVDRNTGNRAENGLYYGITPEHVTASLALTALNAIPGVDLLGVMACPISPESGQECFVCRLVDPVNGVLPDWTQAQESSAPHRFAKKYGVSYGAAAQLFHVAAYATGWLEERIADRLDDILFGRSVGSAA